MKKIVAVFTLLAVLTACGGDGGRPSQDEIADALRDSDDFATMVEAGGDEADELIDCVAEVLHDSDLSDEALQALVDGDEDFDGSGEDEDVMSELQDEFGKCLTG